MNVGAAIDKMEASGEAETVGGARVASNAVMELVGFCITVRGRSGWQAWIEWTSVYTAVISALFQLAASLVYVLFVSLLSTLTSVHGKR
jgi:TctA family transporter